MNGYFIVRIFFEAGVQWEGTKLWEGEYGIRTMLDPGNPFIWDIPICGCSMQDFSLQEIFSMNL